MPLSRPDLPAELSGSTTARGKLEGKQSLTELIGTVIQSVSTKYLVKLSSYSKDHTLTAG